MIAFDPEEMFYGWTIYYRPLDFPNHYVVRMWFIPEPGVVAHHGIACLCGSLDEAREQVPQGTIRVPREPEDDAVIIETWL